MLCVALPWPDAAELRRGQKLQALRDLRLGAVAVSDAALHQDAPATTLEFDLGSDASAAAKSIADATNILVLTDVELCFWPPAVSSSEEAARTLELLKPCSRRRSLLVARRFLCGEMNLRPAGAEHTLLTAVSAAIQAELDHLCAPSMQGSGICIGIESGTSLSNHPLMHVHSMLRVQSLLGRGNGFVAIDEIKPDEEILRIPEEALINIFTALTCPYFRPLACWLLGEGVHPETVALLFTVAERRRCEAMASTSSIPWAELLLKAPSLNNFDLLMTWPSEGVEALGAEMVSEVVSAAMEKMWDMCRELSQVLKRLEGNKLAAALHGPIGFDDLFWARCLFDSRGVEVEIAAPTHFKPMNGTSAPSPAASNAQWLFVTDGETSTWVECPKRICSLAPGIDFLNHDARGCCASPTFDAARRALVIKTAAAVHGGSEVCLSYGALQNWELMMYYGFCAENNPHDRITLSISTEEVEEQAAKEVLMNSHNIPTDHLLRLVPSAEGAGLLDMSTCSGWNVVGVLPPQLLRCLRVLLADDAASLVAEMHSGPPGGEGTSRDLDLRCLDLMEELLNGLRANYETPAFADQPFWWQACGALIERFHASQRSIVDANLEAVEQLRARLEMTDL